MSPSAAATPTPAPVLELVVRLPRHPPVTYRFDKSVVTVGRDPANDIVIPDHAVSRVHLELRRAGGSWIASDRGSLNGTLLRERQLESEQALRPGDELRVGAATLTCHHGRHSWELGGVDTATVSETRGAEAAGDAVLVGDSAVMRRVEAMLQRVAATESHVLLRGESGTGKELAARRIHALSRRHEGPFVVVNCPALRGSLLETELFGIERGVATGVDARSGRLETADGGTLLLDEIGDLDAVAQAMLLRFLQDKTVERVGGRSATRLDVRLLAATNRDLEGAVEAGSFRSDLYYRLNVVSITMPPLRQRLDDVPRLVRHFLARHGRPELELDEDVAQLLSRHPFPGNVRELQHVVERACALADGAVVRVQDLPEGLVDSDVPVAVGEPATSPGASARTSHLYDRIMRDGESFWDVVHRPFLRREVSKSEARALIQRCYDEAGGSYKRMAELFGIEEQHKKLLNFLWAHDLRASR